jgi:hypothetical protein
MNDSQSPQCGARTRAGTPCARHPVPGATRCKLHGGLSPRGIASPTFKHGRHSRHLPTRLAARYQAAMTDPQLLELRSEVALMDARVDDLLSRIAAGNSADAWEAAQTAYADLLSASRSTDRLAATAALDALGAALNGRDDAALWAEVSEVVDLRRRLVESERKQMIASEQFVAVAEIMSLMGAIVASVRAHVTDSQARAAITRDIGRFVEINQEV